LLSRTTCERCSERKRFYKKNQSGDTVGLLKLPSFSEAWELNIVVCPKFLHPDYLNRGIESVEWTKHRLNIASKQPRGCPYALEHCLDAPKESETFGKKIPIPILGTISSFPCPDCGEDLVLSRETARHVLRWSCSRCFFFSEANQKTGEIIIEQENQI